MGDVPAKREGERQEDLQVTAGRGGLEPERTVTLPEVRWAGGDVSRIDGGIVAGRYRVGKMIGEGGMATVHEAVQLFTGRRLAMKFLRRRFRNDAASCARFEREAYAAGIVESANVISVFEFGHVKTGESYIVMEYLAGEGLSALLAREAPLPVPFAIDVAIQTCRGLAAVHAAGVVHRDVKPENLFICRDDAGTRLIKVFDFGIAKRMGDGLAGGFDANSFIDGDAGKFLGTAQYMSPEQMRGADDVDQRSDIYSVGGILFEMLSGETPHPGGTFPEIIDHVLNREPTRIETLRRTLPRRLAAIIHQALDADPGKRFASALELASALAPFAG